MKTPQTHQEWYSDEVGPVGCQIFSGHEKNCGSTVKDNFKQSRSKRYRDDR